MQDVRHKVVPNNHVLWHIDRVVEIKVVGMAVESLVGTLIESDGVLGIAKGQVLGILRYKSESFPDGQFIDRCKYSHEGIGIGNRPEEDTSWAQIARDVFEHHSRFGRRLEGVVHAELHGHVVEWNTSQIGG